MTPQDKAALQKRHDVFADRKVKIVANVRWWDQDSDPPYRINYAVKGSIGRVIQWNVDQGPLDVVFREHSENACWLRFDVEELENTALFELLPDEKGSHDTHMHSGTV